MTSLSRYVKHTPHAVDESLTKLSAIHKRIVAIDMDPDLMELYTRNASAIVQQGVRKEILLHKMNDAKKKSGQTSQCAEGKKSTFTSSLLTTSSSHSSPSLVGDSSLRSTKEDEEYFPFQIAARLQTVLLCQNWCKTINGIVQFCNVTRLSLRNNVIERIRDCEPLGLLPKLQCVALGGNPVARLPNFKCHLLRICSWPKPLSLHACRLREIDGVCVAEMDVKLAMGALHQESVYFPRIAERLHLYDLAVCGRNRFRMEEEWLRNVKQRMEGGISQSSSPSSSSSSAIPRAQRKFSDVFMYALKHHCIRPVDCHRETIDASKGKDYQAYMEDRVRVYILQHFSFSATVVPSRATMGTERKVERPQDKSSVPVADPTHPSRALSSTAPSVQQCAVYSDVLAAIEAEVLQIVYANAPGVSFSTPSKENQEAPPTKSPLWHTWHRVLEVERQWKEKEDEDRRIQEETARKSRLRRSSVKGGAKEESSIMSAESSSGSGGSSGNRSGTRNNTTTDDIRHSFCSSTSFSTTSFSAPSSFSHTKEISLEGGNGSTRRHRPTKGCSSSAAPFPSSTSFVANPFAPPADHSPVPPIFSSSSSSSSIVAPPTPRTPDPDRASQTKHTFSSHVDTFAPHARRPRQAAPPSQVPLDTSVSWISTLSASERSAVSTASTGSRRVIQSPFHHRRPQVKKGIPPTPISSSTVVPPSPSIPSTTRTNAVAHEGESKSSSSSSSCTGSRVGSTMTTTSWVSEPTATLSERLHRPPSPSSQEALATSHPASSQMSLHAVRERTSSSAAVSPSMDVSEPSSLLSFADVTISSISLDGSLDARAGLTPRSRFLSSSSSFTTTPDNTIVHHENDNERARGGGGVRAAATEEDEKKTCAPGNDDPRYTRYHVESSGKGREYQRVRSVLHAIASLHPRELFPSPSPSPSRVVVPSRAVEENTEAPACDGMAGVSPWRERVVAHQERPVEAEKRVTHRTAARESDRETIGSSSSTPTGRWRERVVASENTTPTSPLARDTAAPGPYEKDDDDKVAQQWRRDRSQWGVFQKWRQQCFLRRRNGRVLPSAVGHDHPSVVHEWCPCVASSTAGAGRERTMAIACRQAKEEEEEVPPCNAPPLRAMLSPSALVVTAGESVAKKHRVSDELRKEKSSCCLLLSAHSRSLSYAAVCFVWWRQWATAAHHRRLSMLRRVWHRWCGERGTRWASPKEPTKASADLSTSPPPRRPTVRRVPPLSSSLSYSRSPPIASTVQEEADGNRRWQKATTARRRGKTRWDEHPYYVTMRGGESPAVHLPEKPKGLEECEEKKEHQKKCEMEERGRGKGGVRIPPTTAGLLLRTSTPSREDFSEDPFGVLSRVVHRLQSRPLSASLPFASSSPPRRDDAHDVVDALPLPTESTTTTAASPSAAPCIPADTSSPSLSVPIHLQSSPPPSILSFSSFSHPLDGTPLTHRTAPSSFSSFSSLPLLPHEHPYQLASWSSFHCSAPHALTSLFRPSSRPSRPEGFFPVRQEIGSAFSLCVGEVPSGASWGTPTVSRAPCVVGHPARAPQVSPLCWTSSMPREGDTPATARSNRRMERTPLSTTFSHSSSHRTHAIDTANGRQSSKRETREAIGLSEARRKDDERMRSLSSLSSCKRAPTTRDVHDTRGVHGKRHAPLLRTIETTKQSCDAKGSTRMGDTGKSSSTPPLCAGSEDASVVNGKGMHAQRERQESVRMSPKGSPLPSPKVLTDPSPLSFSSSSSSYASSLGAFSSSCRSSSIISSSSLFRIPTPLLSADGKRGCPTTTMDSRGGAEGGRHATKKEPSRSVGPAISPARLLPTSPVMPTPLARPLDTPPPRKPPLPHANTLLDVFPAVPSWDTGNETCRKAISRSFSFYTSFVEENPFPSTQSDACNLFTSSILSAALPESEPHSGKRSPTKIQDEKRIAFCRTLMEELRTRHAENERKRMQER